MTITANIIVAVAHPIQFTIVPSSCCILGFLGGPVSDILILQQPFQVLGSIGLLCKLWTLVDYPSDTQPAARIGRHMGYGIVAIPGLGYLRVFLSDKFPFSSKFYFNMWFLWIQTSKVGI
uniref:Uncharacterized protein n=1 Tax=Arundo donax TaxID=35708 RepID=A0A0A9DKN9_ARUDO